MTNIVRAAWLALAVIPAALDSGGSSPLSSWVVWTMWMAVALAVLVPHPLSLTTCRFIAPMFVAHLTWIVANAGSTVQWGSVVGLILATVVCIASFTSRFGAAHAQAAAYGHERRHLLRPPVSVVLPVALLWLIAVTTAGIAVHADTTLTAGVATAVFAALLAFSLQRSLVLARRWLVFVPAGIAIHDPLVLRDTFMVRSHEVQALRHAPNDTEAFDLTCATWGVPLEIVLSHPHDVSLSNFGARVSRTLDRLHVTALLIAPTRATEALAART